MEPELASQKARRGCIQSFSKLRTRPSRNFHSKVSGQPSLHHVENQKAPGDQAEHAKLVEKIP